MRYALAANKSHRPGRPLSSNDPRSENFKPAPATRSVTTRDTNTSFEPDCAVDSCGRVNRDAADIAASQFDLARVETCA